MKKIICLVLIVCTLFLSACGSEASKYVKLIDAYAKEKYSANILSGQDTYVKIVNDSDTGIVAYVFCPEGLKFTIKEGALEAYKKGDSILKYVTSSFKGVPGYSAPSQSELDSEWELVKS